ncbi:glycosyltransferase [Ruegeria pomeroyi]|uniref:glycosyltransferase n=1 Tax=Ruegeria pomeroyi TaxID=89184 RepID=UPI001F23B9D9|nr:glycosyltransferase [Ruegeria pomeroyi]MCE8510801.1 glycosyltransferase [Ruegeria pomeroyi]
MDNSRDPLPRLAILLPHLRPGGIETSTVALIRQLQGHRFRIRLILGSRTGALLNQIPDTVETIDLGGRRAMASLWALRAALAGTDAVYSGTNARNISVLLAARLLPARHRPAVIISEHSSPAAYLAMTRHPGPRRWLMRRLYPLADLLVAPTEGLGADWLAALELDRPAVATLPNPVLSPEALALSTQVIQGDGPPRDPAQVLAVGRLHPAKGHADLIRAFAHALRTRPELRLTILGEGEARPELEALIAAMDLQDRVTLPGYSPDVARHMAGAGLFVLPSHREGFGNVVVEALAQGTPVLATDCDGPRRLLGQAGAAGRIVPIGDTQALARGIVEMAGQPAPLRAALATAPTLSARYAHAAAAETFADQIAPLAIRRRR